MSAAIPLPKTLRMTKVDDPRVRGALAREDGTLVYTVVGRARSSTGRGYTIRYHAKGSLVHGNDLAKEVVTYELALAVCVAHWGSL